MNNKKFNIIYFILISLVFLSQSCKRDDGTNVNPIIKCSIDTPYGECDNETDICYKGACIPKDSKCGEILAPCEDKTDICVEDTENNGFKCIEGRCSFNNTNGTCTNELMFCTSRGICEYKCDSEHKTGACIDGQTCLEGSCVNDSELCSDIITNGKCIEGKTCALNTDGVHECLDSCSERYPNGACESTKECKYNKCYFDYEVCSLTNIHGICDEGKLCNNGVCERICSSIVTNGICEYDDQVCFEGNCNYKCSSTRLNGICEEIGTKCVNGDCRFKCSQTVQDGYCDGDNQTCVEGYCKAICSLTEPEGPCINRDQICSEGECEYECSDSYPFGACSEPGYGCLDGNCIEQCSSEYPNGACEQFYSCNNGTCEEIPCGELNPNGFCSDTEQKCIQGICLNECSVQQPNGWCEQPGFICYNNVCTDSTTQACSQLFQDGFCTLFDEECINGQCVKKECSPQYPLGRCDNGSICNNGMCSLSCLDNRPIYQEGSTASLDNGGISGSCCVVNEDCKDGFNSYGNFITDLCIFDQNPEGPYCIGLQLTKNINDSFLCGFVGGCNGCQQDSDCMDPYPTYGTEQNFFCSMVTYYDFQVQTGTKLDISISYCQRVYTNCQRLNKLQGDTCKESCHDSECATGLHCVKGICTAQCKDDSYCIEGANCIPLNYHLPDTDKDIYLDACMVVCENDERCHSMIDNNYSCSTFTYAHQAEGEDIPSEVISFCRPLSNASRNLREFCTQDDDCKSRICGNENLCTTVCAKDEDCGTNAYCHYDALKSGQIIHADGTNTPIELNYLGECRYLESNQGTPSSCTSKSDCPTDLINGKEYQCLPKFDLVKPLPEGKSGDVAFGRCGVSHPIPNKAYSNEGGVCNNSTQLCSNDLCVCGNKLCEDNRIGKCRDYCETSNDCDGDEYCKRILVREDVQYSKSIYVGACVSRNEGIDVDDCNVSATNFNNLCSTDKTCIPNAVNIKPEGDNPNKFGVEYICVQKKEGKSLLNQTCQSDNDCKSQLCNKNTNKCSHACTNNTHCGDVGTGNCKMEHILIEDLNPNFIVYSGICE